MCTANNVESRSLDILCLTKWHLRRSIFRNHLFFFCAISGVYVMSSLFRMNATYMRWLAVKVHLLCNRMCITTLPTWLCQGVTFYCSCWQFPKCYLRVTKKYKIFIYFKERKSVNDIISCWSISSNQKT